MIIHAYGGLANRLRVIMSYGAAGYTHFRWDKDGEIANASFSDVFEPIHGIKFVDGGVHVFRTCDPLQTAPAQWQHGYRLLHLREAVYRSDRPHGPYGAMHVRRTDHTEYARSLGNETSAHEFMAWIRAGATPSCIYLATDNAVSQRLYRAAIEGSGRRCFVHDDITEHDRQDEGGVRNTTLAHAAIDMFVCAGATSFKGTRESSFSDAIVMLKELGGWWS
jgi:hypothetical protein